MSVVDPRNVALFPRAVFEAIRSETLFAEFVTVGVCRREAARGLLVDSYTDRKVSLSEPF